MFEQFFYNYSAKLSAEFCDLDHFYELWNKKLPF